MRNISIKLSIIMNILIFILTIISSVMMFTGFKFMNGYEVVIESTKIGAFKFFTVDSNIFMGIASLVFAIKEINLLKGKIKYIPIKYYILKLMATSAVGLTFFIVFTYLGPTSEYGILSLIMNNNLFFHLIIPVLSIITFVLFEKTDKLKFEYCYFGIIPTVIYELYYLINVLVHMKNGIVSPVYDWYWFVQKSIWTALIVIPVVLGIAYLISLIIWKLNRKVSKV